jgi:N-acyl-D-aspartate/D-glutamate deacylase
VFDLLIRNGKVVDGSGDDPFVGDVAIAGDRIAEVGSGLGRAHREIDADGRLVTPGFVDPHTHFDGQLTWDPLLAPSAHHGVTTVVGGNCGVGFAPARPEQRDWLIGLMAGVEDIPARALAAGLSWEWETYEEFLDYVDAAPSAMDVGLLVTHATVRAYVMGERSMERAEPTPAELEAMAAIVRSALANGALGFSTSRTSLHLSLDGVPVPGTFASWNELGKFARELEAAGGRVFQLALPNSFDDPEGIDRDLAAMAKISAQRGIPFIFNFALNHADPDHWRSVFQLALDATTQGARLYPMVLPRPHTVLVGHQGVHPFARKPSYMALSHLPFPERMARLQQAELRTRILAENALPPDPADPYGEIYDFDLEQLYPLGNPPDYEPTRAASIAGRAEATGAVPMELLYDRLLDDDGRAFLLYTVMNYPGHDLEAVREMVTHPQAVVGLSDAGAHCGSVCDASAPTFMLSHWARDRSRGEKLTLPWVVRALTSAPAERFGLSGRGRIAAGWKADVNVIDLDALRCEAPEVIVDLPTGAPRLTQQAQGYDHTLLSGEVIREAGQDTGARPGRLVRLLTS